jgi:hypothetical protein
MRYLRVVFAMLILWAGVAAALLEPDWITYTVLGTGGAVLLLTLLLEARIRQSDARQVLTHRRLRGRQRADRDVRDRALRARLRLSRSRNRSRGHA